MSGWRDGLETIQNGPVRLVTSVLSVKRPSFHTFRPLEDRRYICAGI